MTLLENLNNGMIKKLVNQMQLKLGFGNET